VEIPQNLNLQKCIITYSRDKAGSTSNESECKVRIALFSNILQ